MYVGNTQSYAGLGSALVRTSQTYGQQIRLVGRVVGGLQSNLLISLSNRPNGNCWFAGLDLSGGLAAKLGRPPGLVIGRVIGGVVYVEAAEEAGFALEEGQTYELEVETDLTGVFMDLRVRADGSGWLALPIPVGQTYDGRVGAAAWLSTVRIDEFNIGVCV